MARLAINADFYGLDAVVLNIPVEFSFLFLSRVLSTLNVLRRE